VSTDGLRATFARRCSRDETASCGDPGPVPWAADLLDWATGALRDLPWRRTRDPWAVLVAEVMLQQTQVERVVPHWQRWTRRWPTPSSLDAEPLAEVLREWQGLGYPRRARNLHLAATVVVDRHSGVVPTTLPELLGLPGVGPYTARAVLAFAHDADVGVLDTNTGRVLARLAGRRLGPAEAQALADAAVPSGEGWRWNQAMLDLGATVCTKRTPDCTACPVVGGCVWRGGDGEPGDSDPATGSAAVSRPQAPFEGSLRQARGLLLSRLAEGPVPEGDADAAVAASLEADGLVERGPHGWRLPR